MARQRGTVKYFNTKKGYGFIGRGDGVPDLFVHYESIDAPQGTFKTLREGERVEFEIVPGEKGPCAHQVRILP